ncbi:MAG TPA: NAD-dependent epimerase/dehydratase family protein [Longimicrobiaceae bacterium]|nr:NAD-dependent epimerase/dehydratase family protein [Longimicrobiaceae bacterium]
MSRTALITGATGFVGGHLAERLAAEGWAVRALVRPTGDATRLQALGAELVPGALDDPAALAAGVAGADTVFHLAAATTAPDEEAYRRVNAEGTLNLARAVVGAEPRPRRLVYLSSYAACGPAPNGHPRRMDEPPAPVTAYGRSKLAGEEAAREAAAAGVELVVVRAPVVYGPGDRAFLPYYRLVQRSLAPVPGGAERPMQIVHVRDLARALVRAADAAPGTYAVAGPRTPTMAELGVEIGRALGTRPRRIPLPPGLVRAAGAFAERFGHVMGGAGVFGREKAEEMLAEAWVCDLAGSEVLLPPEEATPLAEGTAETARWYRTQGWL